MYKVDLENKKLIKIPKTSFSALSIKERFDIQEWIEGTSQILGENLLIIGKELLDQNNTFSVNPEVIISLPEAKDYIQKKESKQKEKGQANNGKQGRERKWMGQFLFTVH